MNQPKFDLPSLWKALSNPLCDQALIDQHVSSLSPDSLLVTSPGKRNRNAVHMAAASSLPILNAVLDALRRSSRWAEGINGQDMDGKTPLHLSLEAGRATCASLLVTSGADLHLRTKTGETTLMSAVRAPDQHVSEVKLLLESGVDIAAVNSAGETAVSLLIKKKMASKNYGCQIFRVLLLLLQHGGVLPALSADHQGLLCCEVASHGSSHDLTQFAGRLGVDALDFQDKLGNTPLHYCMLRMHPSASLYLLERGVNSELRNAEGRTAVQVFIYRVHKKRDPSITLDLYLATLKGFVRRGAHVNRNWFFRELEQEAISAARVEQEKVVKKALKDLGFPNGLPDLVFGYIDSWQRAHAINPKLLPVLKEFGLVPGHYRPSRTHQAQRAHKRRRVNSHR